jgi:hypothetical protein
MTQTCETLTTWGEYEGMCEGWEGMWEEYEGCAKDGWEEKMCEGCASAYVIIQQCHIIPYNIDINPNINLYYLDTFVSQPTFLKIFFKF